MSDEILHAVKEAVREEMKIQVNGKLDPSSPTFALKDIYRFMEETRTHMDETKAIMEAFKGVKAIGELVKWVSGVGLAIAGMYALIRGSIRL